jgi:nitric oxide reductase NorE protein
VSVQPVVDADAAFRDPFATAPVELAARTPPSPRGHIPGEPGIWVFIFGDLVAFTLFFAVFLDARAGRPGVFDAARGMLDVRIGAVNTLLLLTGSLFVALAARRVRAGSSRTAPRLIAAAILCGSGFVINKALEWGHALAAGRTPAANDFFMYFFAFTGIHLLHLLIGLAVLGVMWRIARRPSLSAAQVRTIEAGACYWHLVDVLWLVLFALLYLVR